mmetsp:Transcript_4566/g.11512  ORF Transcript_4566/g.11512 Transcript_4566/m.11512 type:complete len:152 (-) Transcript_4566:203-658(-)|eukprot:CAMPEP_0181106458 /NCGR_PEP_ID=MMETSP1071-20121207/16543_1 /TAXON_ID=35127 /ORGANISM="Thalassiosira sp., Strain NH16" /LENGTH=151 /DNA_ID=CAMNT_0023189867 /DNA_START=256 /DNA_END=711 /DNA_ORIENTATION=-
MLRRSTHALLKRAVELSVRQTASRAASTSTSGSSSLSDYDRIMRTTVSHFSSVAEPSSLSSTTTPPLSSVSFSSATATAQEEEPPTIIVSEIMEPSVKSNCYRSVAEPTALEDYDTYELHHPPCERTMRMEYHFDGDAHVDPGGGEMGSVV